MHLSFLNRLTDKLINKFSVLLEGGDALFITIFNFHSLEALSTGKEGGLC